ncbi:HNH endonuclease signature motif containing protein [Nocardia sp. NPDC047038]|uniref:HNH endonuclease signature motif containing protein n=1 Tax=Nocardia sp. NPDC047038 TaxID=3154338 RepID=UPI0033D989AE
MHNIEDATLTERLTSELSSLEINNARYKSAGTAGILWKESAGDYPVSTVSDEEFIWLYEKKLARKSSPARAYYDRILASALLRRCPYCNYNKATTLDHFLPKKRYASMAIDPWNLVPCCKDCNHHMLAGVALTGSEYGFHPYFEVVTDTWLAVEIVNDAGVAAIFTADCPTSWPPELVMRVQNVFRNLDLADSYASASGAAIAEMQRHLRRLFDGGGSDAVRTHLEESAESIDHVSPNAWRAVLYRGLANCDWYCAGGFEAG